MMQDTSQKATITVYTAPWCAYCARARALLHRRGLVFDEVDVATSPRFRERLAELTGGFTVPQIVIDGSPIGGSDALARLDRAGVLMALARREPFPVERDQVRLSPRSLARWFAARLRGHRGTSALQRRRVLVDRDGRVVGSAGGRPHPAELDQAVEPRR